MIGSLDEIASTSDSGGRAKRGGAKRGAGVRAPVATSTTSNSSDSSLPPLADATLSVTPLAVTSDDCTPVESLNLKPCFLRMR